MRERLPAGDVSNRGTDEANDLPCIGPFGIQVRVEDSDVPPRWAAAQCRRGDERELVPSKAPDCGLVDRRKGISRQDVEIEVEPPRIEER